MRRLGVVLALSAAAVTACGALMGCGGRYVTQPGGDDGWTSYRSGASEIRLRGVEQLIDGKPARMSLHEPLYSGDKTALVLSVPEPLYVYVVNLAPDGDQQIIWPSHEPRQVQGVQRIPEDGGWFTLTGQTGQEIVAVVATRDRQSLTGSGKGRLIRAVESAAAKPSTRLQSALPPGLVEADGGGYATMGVRAKDLRLVGSTVRVTSVDPVVMILDIDHR